MAVTHVTTQGAAITASPTPAITFALYVPVEDDLIVFTPSSQSSVVVESDANLNAAGWFNPLGDGGEINNGAAMGAAIVYHQVTAAEALAATTTYSVTVFTGAETGYVVGDIWRGHDTTSPIRKVGTVASPVGTTSYPTAAVAGVGPPDLVTGDQVMAHLARDAPGAFTPGSAGAGWTDRLLTSVNQGRWAGSRDALTIANTDVDSINVTNAAADESIGITYVIAAASGGVDLTETPEDLVGIVDNVTVQADRVDTHTDVVGITDDATITAERITAHDDLVGITDLIELMLVVERAFDDQVGITDDTLVELDAVIDAPADAVGITDLVLVELTGGPITIGHVDDVGIVDVVTVTVDRVVAVVDPLGITDTVITVGADDVNPQDAVGINDDVTIARSIVIVLEDTIGLSDTAAPADARLIIVTDALGITDTTTLPVAHAVVVIDTIGIVDSLAEEDFDDAIRINHRYVLAIRINGRNVTDVRINGRDVGSP